MTLSLSFATQFKRKLVRPRKKIEKSKSFRFFFTFKKVPPQNYMSFAGICTTPPDKKMGAVARVCLNSYQGVAYRRPYDMAVRWTREWNPYSEFLLLCSYDCVFAPRMICGGRGTLCNNFQLISWLTKVEIHCLQ